MFVFPVREGVALPAGVREARRRAGVAPRAAARRDRRQPRRVDRRVDRHRAAVAAAAAVPVAFLALFFVYPLTAILQRGLARRARPAPGTCSRRRRRRAGLVHAWQAAVSTLLTLAAGLPLAWAVGRFSFPGRSLALALVLVPFVLPTVVVATAFMPSLPESHERGLVPILAAHVFFNVAVVVRIVGTAWARLDRALWDAAAALGAGPLQRLCARHRAPCSRRPSQARRRSSSSSASPRSG